MNIGRKGKTEADRIPAYNGGLFSNDELLDGLIIDDDILIYDLFICLDRPNMLNCIVRN